MMERYLKKRVEISGERYVIRRYGSGSSRVFGALLEFSRKFSSFFLAEIMTGPKINEVTS